jgi:hypothetical protein
MPMPKPAIAGSRSLRASASCGSHPQERFSLS